MLCNVSKKERAKFYVFYERRKIYADQINFQFNLLIKKFGCKYFSMIYLNFQECIGKFESLNLVICKLLALAIPSVDTIFRGSK
jgi:hypothetical protein